MIIKWLHLFYERRIAVPIDANALMLDVGCGEKPHWRADVLVDKFLDASHGKQRNTGGDVKALAPLFESPLESLPFRDKAFDYVYCSHVLEHVTDPKAAIAELMRVGKRGYIEVPFVGIQKIYDQETHLWYCDRQENAITFNAKERFTYDRDIERFLDLGPLKPFAFLMNFYPEAAMMRLYWSEESPIIANVNGSPNLALAIPNAEANGSGGSRIWDSIRKTLRFMFFWKVRREPITFNSVVKPEYRKPVDEVLRPDVYRVAQ